VARTKALAVQTPPFPALGGFPNAQAGGVRFLGVGGTGSGCACCPGTTCLEFLGCNQSALQGVTVNVYTKNGGTLVAGPLTSNSSGFVCASLMTGSYYVVPTGTAWPLNLYQWNPTQIELISGRAVLWGPPVVSGYGCCSTVNFPLPLTLYLTVCSQTFTLVAPIVNHQIQGWAPIGATADITTPFVAVVGDPPDCDLGGWDGVTTDVQTVPWAVRLLCPSATGDDATMTGLAGVCGIGHYNGHIGGFDAFAICPAECVGVGNAYTCCNGGAGPGPGVPFALTGTIGEAGVSLSGTMPGGVSTSCVLPPAAPWPLPCAGEGILVTN